MTDEKRPKDKILIGAKPGSRWEAANAKFMKQIFLYGAATPEDIEEYRRSLSECFHEELMPQLIEGLAKQISVPKKEQS